MEAFLNRETAITVLCAFGTCVTFAVLKWVVHRHRRINLLKRYGIPGPKPRFLDGNMNELKSQPTPNDLISSWTQQYGKVFGYYIGEIPHIVVNDLEMLKQVFFTDFHIFNNRADMFLDVSPLNKTVVALKDNRWKEVRSLLTPTFSSGKIKLMTHIVNKKVDITVSVISKKAENNEMFDIYELIQGLTLDVIAECALAMKTECQENPKDIFLIAVRDFFRFSHNRAVDFAIMFPFVASVLAFINNHLTSGQMTTIIVDNVKHVMELRKKDPSFKSIDILQLMLDHEAKGEKKDGMTVEEIIANAYVFLLAGYETTATALAFTFYLLITHPEIQEKLYREIEEAEEVDYNTIQNFQYLDQVFSESMRLYPPVTGFVSRACNQDHQVGSYTFPRGAVVVAPIWDIQHDPALWPDPWRFDPDRFSAENRRHIHNMAYFPFGLGRRNCIGSRFAQLEAKLAIFRLVKAFRFESCEKTDDPLPLICPTVIINPENGVWLRAVPRSS